jgi:hypothetical protein
MDANEGRHSKIRKRCDLVAQADQKQVILQHGLELHSVHPVADYGLCTASIEHVDHVRWVRRNGTLYFQLIIVWFRQWSNRLRSAKIFDQYYRFLIINYLLIGWRQFLGNFRDLGACLLLRAIRHAFMR